MRINEIFYSIQGEGATAGYPTIFIRLTGCNLRCTYCDTKYSYHGGEVMSVDDVIDAIKKYYPCMRVCITGGEPLLHKKELPELMGKLNKAGYEMSVETSGSLPIKDLPRCASFIIDIKTPSSGMEQHNLFENLEHLSRKDEVKFVVGTEEDLAYTQKIIESHKIECPIIISPVWEMKDKEKVATWLLEKNYPRARIGIQMHKTLNVE